MNKLSTIFRSKPRIAEPIPTLTQIVERQVASLPLTVFKSEVVKIGVEKMLRSDYFSICDFDKLVKVHRVVVDAEIYDCLHALHCVHWNKMSIEVRQTVYSIIAQTFGGTNENV